VPAFWFVFISSKAVGLIVPTPALPVDSKRFVAWAPALREATKTKVSANMIDTQTEILLLVLFISGILFLSDGRVYRRVRVCVARNRTLRRRQINQNKLTAGFGESATLQARGIQPREGTARTIVPLVAKVNNFFCSLLMWITKRVRKREQQSFEEAGDFTGRDTLLLPGVGDSFGGSLYVVGVPVLAPPVPTVLEFRAVQNLTLTARS
jgi:hypothetical protein